MFYAYAVIGKRDDQEWVASITSNGPTAEKTAKNLSAAAVDPDSEYHGATFSVARHFFSIDLFDLWEMIRVHPAYAFGALFTMGDFDRGVPQKFSADEAEQLLVDTGQGHLDGLYTGEPGKHRIASRLRRLGRS